MPGSPGCWLSAPGIGMPSKQGHSDSLSCQTADEIHYCYPTADEDMNQVTLGEAEMKGQSSLEMQSERSCLGWYWLPGFLCTASLITLLMIPGRDSDIL